MVKHIVFIKLENNSEENKTEVQERLLTMKDAIGVLQKIEVGLNFANEDRAYDIALLTDFDSKKDLGIYATHPYHMEIVSYLKTVALSSKVVDFQY
ncbi:MAG: Dabb family protein [Epsilonproteobacteria bacterium]|nr:Dabb family protein [Campylobacterota bacterium]